MTPLPRKTTVLLTIIRKNTYVCTVGNNAALVLKKGVHGVTSVFRRLSSKCEAAK